MGKASLVLSEDESNDLIPRLKKQLWLLMWGAAGNKDCSPLLQNRLKMNNKSQISA